MQLAKREWHARWARGVASALALGAVLGVLGPFGSQTALSTPVKYAFWMGLTLSGFGAAAATARLLPSALGEQGRAVRVLAISAVSAIPMTFVVAWTMGLVRPGRSFTPLQMLALFPFVTLVQMLIAGVLVTLGRSGAAGIDPAAPQSVESEARYPSEFLAKLPPALCRDILALEAEDHYVRVHTRHGSALVLMRLADAAALIDPRLGQRVHRSWWVASDAVRALDRSSGRAAIRLADDRQVPVSRTYLPAARQLAGG